MLGSEEIFNILRLMLFCILAGLAIFLHVKGQSVEFSDYELRSQMYTERLMNAVDIVDTNRSVAFVTDEFVGSYISSEYVDRKRFGLRVQLNESISGRFIGEYYFNKETFTDYYPLTRIGETSYRGVSVRRVFMFDDVAQPVIITFDYAYRKS